MTTSHGLGVWAQAARVLDDALWAARLRADRAEQELAAIKGAFPVYKAVEWQCHHVDPETKLCCVRELNHDGDHRLADLEYGKP